MKSHIVIALVAIGLMSGGCATKEQKVLEKSILSPESVEIYDVSAKSTLDEVHHGRKLLRNFPFVAKEPVLDFNGKFSHQFYDKIDYRYKFSQLRDVDFWKLRTNPFAEDFIYTLPTWSDEFKRVSNDLFTNLGFTYNLSTKEQEILKWWIGQGGILWVEGGIYSTRYDTFKKNGDINHKAIVKKVVDKSKNLRFFDKSVKTYMSTAKKVDYINYIPLKQQFKTTSNIAYFKDIRNVELVSQDFLSVDFMPKARTLLKTTSGKTLVSFVQYGKGGVVFLRPFEYKDKMYDGELLRWKLMYYLINRMYNDKEAMVVEEVKVPVKVKVKSPVADKVIILHNLHFAYKSAKLENDSRKNLGIVVKYLEKHPKTIVEVAGYTDSIGSNSYNYDLSSRRAASVLEALVEMGINSKRIIAKGYGETSPVATNATKQGRALNRRIEFILKQR